MLNFFPDLFTYAILAPTLLRLAAAAAFAYGAYYLWTERERVAHMNFPIIGRVGWLGNVAMVAYIILAGMLAMGYYTQIAALVGAFESLKGAVLARKYANISPLSQGTYFLLLAILLSLMLTGAGAFAQDLPGGL